MFDGKAFGKEIVGVVKEFVGKELAPILSRMDAIEKRLNELPTPRDGKDADLGEVRQIIAAEVGELKTVLASIQAPESQPEDIAALVADAVKKALAEQPQPKDGVGLAGAFIDRDGNLAVTLTNGDVKTLGPVIGKDGENGLGFDDLDALYDGEKTVTLKFSRGEKVKEFKFTLPVVIDRGIYAEGKDYMAGDGVTWGGSFWIAQKDTASKPGEGGDWRLSVKKGRDGRDGVTKEAKPKEPIRVGVPGKVA